ncbi:MAG: nucleobase:cation symporter-2 family protein [Helcococcus sp.]|nr:nucleobase:cation symporter-2 family protein [Helcococcus sp.]
MDKKIKNSSIIYDFEDRPRLIWSIPLAFQHIVSMFVANITVPLLVSQVLNLTYEQTSFFIQCALLSSGIATLIQINKIGVFGSKLPIVMGTSNAFIATVIAITKNYSIGAALGASLIGSLIETFIGFNLNYLKKFFNNLVSGIIVTTIGITLIPVAFKQAMDLTSKQLSIESILISSLVLLIIIVLSASKNKTIKTSSVLISILAGYLIMYFIGELSFKPVVDANWITVPIPYQYKFEFKIGPILAMAFMYIATSIETVGDVSAITYMAKNREASNEELKGAVLSDGIGSLIASFLNAFPNTSYTQNIGVMSLTGVYSRHIVKIGGIMLIIGSLFPKLAAVIAIIPKPVLGGASIAMFSMIVVSGLSILKRVEFTNRNLLIIAISIGVGVGLSIVPEYTSLLSQDLQFILTSGVIPSGILAITMDKLLPKE